MVAAATYFCCTLGAVIACAHAETESAPRQLASGGMPADHADAGATQAGAGFEGGGAGEAASEHGGSGGGDEGDGGERSVGEGGTSGDKAGAAGAANEKPVPASTLEIAVGFNVGIELPGAASEYTVLEAPVRGELRRDGGDVVYLPPWAHAGTDRFEYLRSHAGTVVRHRVEVTVEPPWLLLLGKFLRPVLVAEARAFFDGRGTEWLGEAANGPVVLQGGALRNAAELASSSIRGFLDERRLIGYGGEPGAVSGLLWASRRDEPVAYPVPGSVESRWLFGRDGVACGHARGGHFAAERFQAVRCDLPGSACVVLSPDAAGDGRAFAARGAMTVGSVVGEAGEQACVWRTARCEPIEAEGTRASRLTAILGEDEFAGTIWEQEGYPAGVTLDRELRLITHPSALGLELSGASALGLVAGSVDLPSGRSVGFVTTHVIAAKRGFRYVSREEPDDPSVRHACLHTQEGPFSALVASPTRDSAPLMERTHVSYRVTLPPGGSGLIALRAPRAGDYTLFLDEPATLVARDSSDVVLEPFAVRSALCPRIRWIHQFRVRAAGDVEIELGLRRGNALSVVLESGLAFP